MGTLRNLPFRSLLSLTRRLQGSIEWPKLKQNPDQTTRITVCIKGDCILQNQLASTSPEKGKFFFQCSCSSFFSFISNSMKSRWRKVMYCEKILTMHHPSLIWMTKAKQTTPTYVMPNLYNFFLHSNEHSRCPYFISLMLTKLLRLGKKSSFLKLVPNSMNKKDTRIFLSQLTPRARKYSSDAYSF